MSINKTLTERGGKYGSFADNARIAQELMGVLETAPNYNKLAMTHKEALHMICHKMARMVCGDCMYADNPHDIAGYATLLEEWMNVQNNLS